MIVSSSASSGFFVGSGSGDSSKATKKVTPTISLQTRRKKVGAITFFHSKPFLIQKLGDHHPLFRVPLQTLLHARNHACWHASFKVLELLRWASRARRADHRGRIFRKIDSMCCVRDRLHFLVNREVLEWWVTVDHLIKNAAERPHITRSADFEASHAIGKLDGFRGHVIHSTDLWINKVSVQRQSLHQGLREGIT
jgi:hypothetical protein